jgi:hypothetical protein
MENPQPAATLLLLDQHAPLPPISDDMLAEVYTVELALRRDATSKHSAANALNGKLQAAIAAEALRAAQARQALLPQLATQAEAQQAATYADAFYTSFVAFRQVVQQKYDNQGSAVPGNPNPGATV